MFYKKKTAESEQPTDIVHVIVRETGLRIGKPLDSNG